MSPLAPTLSLRGGEGTGDDPPPQRDEGMAR
jgi:hypothetical protein